MCRIHLHQIFRIESITFSRIIIFFFKTKNYCFPFSFNYSQFFRYFSTFNDVSFRSTNTIKLITWFSTIFFIFIYSICLRPSPSIYSYNTKTEYNNRYTIVFSYISPNSFFIHIQTKHHQ